MLRRAAASICALFPSILLCGSASPSDDVAEVRSCVESNAPRESSYQLLEVESIDHTGSVRHRRAKVYWKLFPDDLSKLLARVIRPVDTRGSAYLMIETDDRPDMFVYLPAVGRVRRINSRAASSSLFGTDFSYEDVEYLQGIAADATVRRRPDGDFRGRPTYVIQAEILDSHDSAYGAVRYHVDQQTCSTLQVDFVARDGELLKQLEVEPESLFQAGHSWVPRRSTMTDLENGTHTNVTIEEIEVDGEMGDHIFSQSSLIRRR